jgi:hypothetical protein
MSLLCESRLGLPAQGRKRIEKQYRDVRQRLSENRIVVLRISLTVEATRTGEVPEEVAIGEADQAVDCSGYERFRLALGAARLSPTLYGLVEPDTVRR